MYACMYVKQYCLQRFDAVAWAFGRHSPLKQLPRFSRRSLCFARSPTNSSKHGKWRYVLEVSVLKQVIEIWNTSVFRAWSWIKWSSSEGNVVRKREVWWYDILSICFMYLSTIYTNNNTTFSDATAVCDLGVDVDSSLKYDGHINLIVAKIFTHRYTVPWFFQS